MAFAAAPDNGGGVGVVVGPLPVGSGMSVVVSLLLSVLVSEDLASLVFEASGVDVDEGVTLDEVELAAGMTAPILLPSFVVTTGEELLAMTEDNAGALVDELPDAGASWVCTGGCVTSAAPAVDEGACVELGL